jgi:phage/conjugal plasmid C-4 type zinc finger TraR family protein
MPDDADLAQQISERFLDVVLADRARRKLTGLSLIYCEDCDGEIPEARRVAQRGCTRCVGCQEAYELLAHWRN